MQTAYWILTVDRLTFDCLVRISTCVCLCANFCEWTWNRKCVPILLAELMTFTNNFWAKSRAAHLNSAPLLCFFLPGPLFWPDFVGFCLTMGILVHVCCATSSQRYPTSCGRRQLHEPTRRRLWKISTDLFLRYAEVWREYGRWYQGHWKSQMCNFWGIFAGWLPGYPPWN